MKLCFVHLHLLFNPIIYWAGTDQRGRANRGRLRERRLFAGGALDLHERVPRRLVSRSARSKFGKVGRKFHQSWDFLHSVCVNQGVNLRSPLLQLAGKLCTLIHTNLESQIPSMVIIALNVVKIDLNCPKFTVISLQ